MFVRRALFLALSATAAATTVFAFSERSAHAYCRSTTCTGDCARDADNCKTEGLPLFWPTSCVGFSLQADGSEYFAFKYFEDVAEKSFLAWTDLDCPSGTATLTFSRLADVSCHAAEYNDGGTNANVILFQDTMWQYTSADNTLAKTTVTFDADTGEILDADIELNHAYNDFTISDTNIDYDLQSVLTHEIGHFVGLDHTPDETATMFATYEPGTIEQRTLETDDVDAICTVYPPERTTACDPNPRGGLGDACGGDPSPAGGGGGGGSDGDGDSSGCSIVAPNPSAGVLPLLAVLALSARRRRTHPSSRAHRAHRDS
ncbi:MAG: matrixin family metalloprotease [Polyangiaceae bacterium]